MKDDRKSCFFVVFDWMLTDLKLSGYQAFIYAAIYNDSQDLNGCFSGSISYLQKALGASRNAVISALAELTKKGLIAKKETLINGVKFNTYRATVRNCPVVKKLPLSDVWK
ncbi:MAG: helix-turn-helix domain-containing protein [Alistipes senegalensis]|nr:helix-turn-helix domain-containing protein [Oxalobacter formigenes]MCM1280929.1 helix-turn-helix domain-containing protein [Alistipes senegalensis]